MTVNVSPRFDIFNSTVVQLEASIDRGKRILRDIFNSTVVQLEAFNSRFSENPVEIFNSTVVQLEDGG